jgi:hypothetical protein
MLFGNRKQARKKTRRWAGQRLGERKAKEFGELPDNVQRKPDMKRNFQKLILRAVLPPTSSMLIGLAILTFEVVPPSSSPSLLYPLIYVKPLSCPRIEGYNAQPVNSSLAGYGEVVRA